MDSPLRTGGGLGRVYMDIPAGRPDPEPSSSEGQGRSDLAPVIPINDTVRAEGPLRPGGSSSKRTVATGSSPAQGQPHDAAAPVALAHAGLPDAVTDPEVVTGSPPSDPPPRTPAPNRRSLRHANARDALPPVPVTGLANSFVSRRVQLYLLQLTMDLAIVLSSFAIAYLLLPQIRLGVEMMRPAMLLAPIYVTIAFYNATFSVKALTDWRLGSVRSLSALLVGVALLSFMSFLTEMPVTNSRLAFVAGMALTATGFVASRIIGAHLIHRAWGPGTMNRLVIQAGGPAVALRHALTVNAAEHGLVPDVEQPAALDRLAQYLLNMDQVIVSCPERDCLAWSEVLKGSGVHGEVISRYANEIGALGIVHHDGSRFSTLLVSSGPLSARARMIKRTFDIVVSSVALIAFAPLLLVVALLIKLEDGGSVFFRQRRMGRGNRFFWILKFRSMREAQADADGTDSTARDDARITRIGALLRKTSIDELPQLINVLRGEMSLVGPRPHALGSQAGSKLFWQVDRRYWQRHCLKPGITGLAQVRGYRGATETEEDLADRLQADLEYIQGWTIWRDIGVLFSTLKVIVHDRAF